MALKKHSKQDVKSKRTLTDKNHKRKIGVEVTFNDGTKSVILNPSDKVLKYARELSERRHLTNKGTPKVDKNGKEKRLTDAQASFRTGYLKAQSDNAKAFKAKQNKSSKDTVLYIDDHSDIF